MEEKNYKKRAKQSGRYPFIAEHRDGPLSIENHRRLIRWARECAEHVLPLIGKEIDGRLIYALDTAREWENGNVATGAAMKASQGAHAVAREAKDPVTKAVARSVGQAVATAHMADHSPVAAYYALKAVKLASRNLVTEREWQTKKLKELPSEIIESVQHFNFSTN